MAAARKNRRRRRNRGRVGFLLKLLCAVAVVMGLTFGATVFFRVEEIIVAGNSRYTQEEIVEVTGIRPGDNLYRINKTVISSDLRKNLPYIEGVNIRRDLPNAIIITVNESEAVGSIAVPPPLPPEPPKAEPEEGEEQEEPEIPPKPATEPWLISGSGKLLEVGGPEKAGMTISGITPLDPSSGSMLRVPESEEHKRQALLELLDALRELGRTQRVSQVELSGSWLELKYDGRFLARMPLNADFVYKLNVLEAVSQRTLEKHGQQTTGMIDLTREDCDAVYTPSRG